MKKMLFSAIAMVAFSVNSSAQTGILVIDISDSLDCGSKADKYVASLGPLSEQARKSHRKAYFDGCMDGKKKDKATVETNKTISKG